MENDLHLIRRVTDNLLVLKFDNSISIWSFFLSRKGKQKVESPSS